MLEVNAAPIPAAGLTIADAARRTGVSAHTLRYYERAGLVVTRVDRTTGGRRRYRKLDLDWIRAIREYAELVAAGRGNEKDRLELMEAHRAEVLAKLAELQENLQLIDHKIDVYRAGSKPGTRIGSGRLAEQKGIVPFWQNQRMEIDAAGNPAIKGPAAVPQPGSRTCALIHAATRSSPRSARVPTRSTSVLCRRSANWFWPRSICAQCAHCLSATNRGGRSPFTKID